MGAASSGPARGRGVFHVKHCAKDPGGEAAWFDERAWPIDGTEIIARGVAVPLWVSAFGVLAPGLIAWLLWKESR